jgi:hypothetical protein
MEGYHPSAVRIFWFPPTVSIRELRALEKAVANVARSSRIAVITGVRAIALRATDQQAAAAENVVQLARARLR